MHFSSDNETGFPRKKKGFKKKGGKKPAFLWGRGFGRVSPYSALEVNLIIPRKERGRKNGFSGGFAFVLIRRRETRSSSREELNTNDVRTSIAHAGHAAPHFKLWAILGFKGEEEEEEERGRGMRSNPLHHS